MHDCIFCKIIHGHVPMDIIYEASDFLVIKDIEPKAPVHLLIVAKRHIASLNEVKASDKEMLGSMLHAVKEIAAAHGIATTGYKVVINCGEHGGQIIPHLHVHLLGGIPLGGIT